MVEATFSTPVTGAFIVTPNLKFRFPYCQSPENCFHQLLPLELRKEYETV